MESRLTSLVISFYFKGGKRELGCEFLHKSFREYFFAESILEDLKEYGRNTITKLEEKQDYWKEFDSDDPRYKLIRKIAPRLSAQWLRPEVTAHLERLIEWELDRSKVSAADAPGRPTDPLSLEQWQVVRDGLVDIWDWWAEGGVHLRPQLRRTSRQQEVYDAPYVQELIELALPMVSNGDSMSAPPARTVTMDAHLGDALFRLNCWLHFQVARQEGWLGSWEGVSELGDGARRYQSAMTHENKTFTLFRPHGTNPQYFVNYMARVNAAGWYLGGSFPAGCNLSGVNLGGADLSRADLSGADLSHAYLSHAYLSGADLRRAYLSGAYLSGAYLSGADLSNAYLRRADLRRADLRNTYLRNAYLGGAFLRRADLSRADLSGADLRSADLRSAILRGAYLSSADLRSAYLSGADLSRADLRSADLRDARFVGRELRYARKLNLAIGIEDRLADIHGVEEENDGDDADT